MAFVNNLTSLQSAALSALLKSKVNGRETKERLIERFTIGIADQAKKQLETFAGQLLNLALSHRGAITPKELLALLEVKTDGFNYNIDIDILVDLYFKAGEEAEASIDGLKKAASEAVLIPAFDKKDANALAAIYDKFISAANDASANTQMKIKEALARSITEGLSYEQIGDAMRESLQGIIDRDFSYFKTLSHTLSRQCANIAAARRYVVSGAPFVKVVARIDAKTSAICLSMNGRIIPIDHIKRQLDAIGNADTIGAQIRAADLGRSAAILGELPANIGIPPYHFNCRTDVVPYYSSAISETLQTERNGKIVSESFKVDGHYKRGDEIKVYNAERDKTEAKTVRYAAIASDGHTRIVTDETYNHPSAARSYKPPEGNIRAALNSIIMEADGYNPELGLPTGRTIALSSNNMILIFDGDYVLTAFYRQNKKDALSYFERNSVPSTRQKIQQRVIKWVKWIKEFLKSI
ncbi:MAG: hypothetical protein LBI57_03970 [Helicobacteraceae bacterium]|jgi:hypothetical protein|nr:hypothetical protein [Helicobacteraceae bacterium]